MKFDRHNYVLFNIRVVPNKNELNVGSIHIQQNMDPKWV